MNMPAPECLPVVAHASHHASSSRRSTPSTIRVENHRSGVVACTLSARLAMYGAHLPISERQSPKLSKASCTQRQHCYCQLRSSKPQSGMPDSRLLWLAAKLPNILNVSYVKIFSLTDSIGKSLQPCHLVPSSMLLFALSWPGCRMLCVHPR
jgi:hypothetical protein